MKIGVQNVSGQTSHICIDNGTMIAELGRRMLDCGLETELMDSGIDSITRTDNTAVVWS